MIYNRFQLIRLACAEPCTRRSSPPYMFSLFAVNFKSIPIIMLVTEKNQTNILFLDKTHFFNAFDTFTPARSIPAPKFTNIAMPALALVLTCNTHFFGGLRRLRTCQLFWLAPVEAYHANFKAIAQFLAFFL